MKYAVSWPLTAKAPSYPRSAEPLSVPLDSRMESLGRWLHEAIARETIASRRYREHPSPEAAHALKLAGDEVRHVERRIATEAER